MLILEGIGLAIFHVFPEYIFNKNITIGVSTDNLTEIHINVSSQYHFGAKNI